MRWIFFVKLKFHIQELKRYHLHYIFYSELMCDVNLFCVRRKTAMCVINDVSATSFRQSKTIFRWKFKFYMISFHLLFFRFLNMILSHIYMYTYLFHIAASNTILMNVTQWVTHRISGASFILDIWEKNLASSTGFQYNLIKIQMLLTFWATLFMVLYSYASKCTLQRLNMFLYYTPRIACKVVCPKKASCWQKVPLLIRFSHSYCSHNTSYLSSQKRQLLIVECQCVLRFYATQNKHRGILLKLLSLVNCLLMNFSICRFLPVLLYITQFDEVYLITLLLWTDDGTVCRLAWAIQAFTMEGVHRRWIRNFLKGVEPDVLWDGNSPVGFRAKPGRGSGWRSPTEADAKYEISVQF